MNAKRRSKNQNKLFRRCLAFLFLSLGISGCALTTTRPIQEMSNAEVALRAAKDLNADSLVPELYRNAVDSYFKAKRDYRLKNFESSKKYALKAMRLAEQAEFEAYRMGGATPEASTRLVTPEGSSADPDAAFRSSNSGFEEVGAQKPAAKNEPTLPTETKDHVEKGQDYEGLLRQQEAEKEKAGSSGTEKKEPGPAGQTGPGQLSGSGIPPSAGSAPPILTQPQSRAPAPSPPSQIGPPIIMPGDGQKAGTGYSEIQTLEMSPMSVLGEDANGKINEIAPLRVEGSDEEKK